nr:MAG TPA: hypothetical protein [Caudoviricetes sp.]
MPVQICQETWQGRDMSFRLVLWPLSSPQYSNCIISFRLDGEFNSHPYITSGVNHCQHIFIEI